MEIQDSETGRREYFYLIGPQGVMGLRGPISSCTRSCYQDQSVNKYPKDSIQNKRITVHVRRSVFGKRDRQFERALRKEERLYWNR